jgi:hypothetical protein
MFHSRTHKPKKIDSVVASRGLFAKVVMMVVPAPSKDKIRERAFELYEGRGREPGKDEQDWLLAEREVLKLA